MKSNWTCWREKLVRTFKVPVARYLRQKRVDDRPCGERNDVKIDEDVKMCLKAILSEIISENSVLTLSAINARLHKRLPEKPIISDRTVAEHLEGMLFTLKLAHPVPAECNGPDVT